MAQSLFCRRQKARGMWSGLFQGCIAKPLRSRCPWVVGRGQSILHSQTASRTGFCTGEAAGNPWGSLARAGEMLLTLTPACGNVQFTTKGAAHTSCDNSKWHFSPPPKTNWVKWGKQVKWRGWWKRIKWNQFKNKCRFFSEMCCDKKSMWKFSCPGGPVDVQTRAGFSAHVTSSLYALPLPYHVTVMSLV